MKSSFMAFINSNGFVDNMLIFSNKQKHPNLDNKRIFVVIPFPAKLIYLKFYRLKVQKVLQNAFSVVFFLQKCCISSNIYREIVLVIS